MPKIQLLSKHVAELIAAGEVVERPSSIVKELVENSIDAGSASVTVEIQKGGIAYLRIADNGGGIEKDDIRNAFVRHATSKISSEDDLERIGTLGFRGEALASIASVCRVELLTKTRGDVFGTRYVVNGSGEELMEEVGCPEGTTIIVRDVFYNTPARMKFLKSDVAEGNAVAGVLDKLALSHPEISFRFIRDGREELFTPGDGSLKSAVYAVMGKSFSEGMLPVDYDFNSIKVYGFTSYPDHSRPTKNLQNFFVNGRYVKTKTCMAAIAEAYKNSIMVSKFPACVLFLSLPADKVDVNVHPAKIEVRFQNEKEIFESVYFAIKDTLSKDHSRPSFQLSVQPKAPVEEVAVKQLVLEPKVTVPTVPSQMISSNSYRVMEDSYPISDISNKSGYLKGPVNIEIEPDPADFEQKAPFCKESAERTPTGDFSPASAAKEEAPQQMSFRFIGEAFHTYVLIETGGEILVIDKHAAHERYIFNSLKTSNGELVKQILLSPVAVTLSKEEYSALVTHLDLLEQYGFSMEDFGPGTVLVRAVPMFLDQKDIADLAAEMAGNLLASKNDLSPKVLDDLLHSIACKSAVRGGDRGSEQELSAIVSMVLNHDDVRYCPHGRPVAFSLTKKDLEKQFGR